MIRLLITSISAKTPLVNCVRESIEQYGIEVHIIGADSNPHAIARYFTDDFWHLPYLNDLTIEELLQYCRIKQINIIIPTREAELLFFARHKSTLERHSIHVMVSDESSLNKVQDKLLFYKFLRAKGYPFIQTSVTIDDINAERYVVKERYGAGSANLILNVTKSAATERAQHLNNPIFQPYINGTEYSIDVYVDRKGIAKGAIVRERVVVIAGESQVTKTLRHKKLEQMAMSLAEELQLQGHVMFQVIVTPTENYYIVECNPRFGGASTLSVRAGLDSFYWFFQEAYGNDISQLPFNRSKRELTQVRYKKDMIL